MDIANAALAQNATDVEKQLQQLATDDALRRGLEGLPGLLPRRAGPERAKVEALVAKYRDARGQLVTFAKAGQTAQFIAYRSEVTTPITKDAFAQLDAVSAIEKKAAQDMAVEGKSTTTAP